MGLNLSPELAESIAESLAEHAKAKGSFVRIDMEDSSLTQVTLEIVRRLHAKPELRGAIGVVIQAYLYRSQADIEQLLAEGIRVRLCKGAYQEPAEVAFPRKADVDANYVRLSYLLLASPIYHGLATHDEAMIAAAKIFAQASMGSTPAASSFRCSSACAATCSASWCARATKCASMFPSAAIGTPTSCGGWPSGRLTCSSWPRTFSVSDAASSYR